MAVWFIEGFDHYLNDTFGMPGAVDTSVDLLRKWTGWINGTPGNIYVIEPLYARQQPGQGLWTNGQSPSPVIYKNRPAGSQATLIFGGAMAFVTLPGTGSYCVIFYDNVTEQCSLRGDSAGHLTISRAGTVLGTSTNVISVNTWYYIEIKITIHNTAGVIELRVNGTSTGWIPSTGSLNTRSTANNYATGIGIGGYASVKWDDLYMADITGSYNNDFLGPQIVACLRPVAPGTYTQFTPNFGPNFANVNEQYPDADLTFNADTVAGHIDTFAMADVPIASGVVTAIQHVIYAKQDAGATRTMTPMQHTGSGDTAGPTTFTLGTSYQYLLDCRDANPDTGVPFTIAGINAAEFGYKLVS